MGDAPTNDALTAMMAQGLRDMHAFLAADALDVQNAPANVDALMTMIVRSSTHTDALGLARQMPPRALRDLCDLLHVDVPESSPDKLTLALRVVIEGRGLNQGEARDLCASVKRRVPMFVG